MHRGPAHQHQVAGAIRPPVIQALEAAEFQVQTLTRKNSEVKPEWHGVSAVEVDYRDATALRNALTGQEAVTSGLGGTASAVVAQKALIKASAAAGTKRFPPPEVGSDTSNDRVRSFPFFADKVKQQELSQSAADKDPGFMYSIIVTGPFLDWGLSVVPFIISVGSSSTQGDIPYTTRAYD